MANYIQYIPTIGSSSYPADMSLFMNALDTDVSTIQAMGVTEDYTLEDNISIVLGTGSDTSITHNGSNTIINHSGTGDLIIQNSTNTITLADSITTFSSGIVITAGSITLTSGNLTISGGVVASGGLSIPDDEFLLIGTGNDLVLSHDGTNSVLINNTGTMYFQNGLAADVNLISYNATEVTLYANNAVRLSTTAAGITVTGVITSKGLKLADNEQLLIGTGPDLAIYHTGTASYMDNSTGTMYFRNGTTNLMSYTSSTATIYHSGSAQLTTSATGLLLVAKTIDMPDDAHILLGTGNDIDIYHSASASYLNNKTGLMNFQYNGSPRITYSSSDVRLYHSGSLKLNTLASGINISGNLDVTADLSIVGDLSIGGDTVYPTGVIQVVTQACLSTLVQSVGSEVNTGFSVTFTPKATTSKIVARIAFNYRVHSTDTGSTNDIFVQYYISSGGVTPQVSSGTHNNVNGTATGPNYLQTHSCSGSAVFANTTGAAMSFTVIGSINDSLSGDNWQVTWPVEVAPYLIIEEIIE